jgi:hypothetical protein
MRFSLIAVLVIVLSFSSVGLAQKAGSLVAGLDVGITSAVGDFRDDTLEAGSGFGVGAELRYTLFNSFSFGPFIRYHRFGSNIQSTEGSFSYNFTQYGGMAKLSMFNVDKGKIYLVGGGGLFKPTEHVWTPDFTSDEEWDSGIFFMGGLGLSSNPYSSTIYEFEVRFNMGDAKPLSSSSGEKQRFDFVYFVIKLSFNSKGSAAPPRY